jgi:hypothetical protein
MNREALTKLQATIIVAVIICIVIIGVSTWWVARREPTPLPPAPGETKSIIKVEAEGVVLHYSNELFWNEDAFLRILEHKTEFESNLIEQFNEKLSTCGERDEHTVYANVEFNGTRKSTILICDIQGAMISSDYFTFRWLLDPLGLDFIDNNFQESEKGLFWEGPINGVPTTITLSFPFPIAHCHAHVWRK